MQAKKFCDLKQAPNWCTNDLFVHPFMPKTTCFVRETKTIND